MDNNDDECHQEQLHVPNMPGPWEDLGGTEDFTAFQQLCLVLPKYCHLGFFHPPKETHVALVSTEEN